MAAIQQLPGKLPLEMVKGDTLIRNLLFDGIDPSSVFTAGFTEDQNDGSSDPLYFVNNNIAITYPISVTAAEGQEGDPVGTFRKQIEISSSTSGSVTSNKFRWFLKTTLSGVTRAIIADELLIEDL